MKAIELTQGKVTAVPGELFKQLNSVKWHAAFSRSTFYALHWVRLPNGKRQRKYLHNIIWELLHGPIPKGFEVDHKDNNGLNNADSNLRLATRRQQSQNRRIRSNSTTGLIGVTWRTDASKFLSQSTDSKGKRSHLGLYESKFEAALVRDLDVLSEYGDFAVLNFPGFFELQGAA